MANAPPASGSVAFAPAAGLAVASRSARARKWWRGNQFAVYAVAPTIVVLFALTVFPTVYSIYISLYDYYLPRPQAATFVGLDNFVLVLTDARFWTSMLRTGIFMTASIVAEFLLGLALALFFFRELRGHSLKAVYLPLVLIPMMVAPVVIGYMWRLLYQVEFGPVNYLLREFLGIGPYEWTASPDLALLSVIITDIWEWTPYVTLVLLAGLVSLPQELLESAAIDGATGWRRVRYIILPLIRRVIAIVLLIRVLDAFRELDKIFVMTQGGPGTATETVSFYAYLAGFKYFRIGYASAMSILLLVVTVLICTLIAKLLHTEQEGTT